MPVGTLIAALPIAVKVVSTIKNSIEALSIWQKFRDRSRAKSKLSQGQIEITQVESKVKKEANELALLIPEDMLIAFQSRIDRCKSRYTHILNSPQEYLDQEVDDASKAYIKCICRELNRIKLVNNEIPNGEMKRFWKSYSCSNFNQFS